MEEKRILLIEDNPDDVELTLRAFKKSNVVNQVDVVRDGAEALDYLFRQGAYADHHNKTPALVLLDLKLPKIDGLQVLQRLREDERTQYIPVIILTSSKEDIDIIRSYESGCNAFVRKPVDFAEFMKAVNYLGLFWLLLNRPPPEQGGN